MVIICPMGMEHRLTLTLLPVFFAFLSSPKASTLCSSQIVHSVTPGAFPEYSPLFVSGCLPPQSQVFQILELAGLFDSIFRLILCI